MSQQDPSDHKGCITSHDELNVLRRYAPPIFEAAKHFYDLSYMHIMWRFVELWSDSHMLCRKLFHSFHVIKFLVLLCNQVSCSFMQSSFFVFLRFHYLIDFLECFGFLCFRENRRIIDILLRVFGFGCGYTLLAETLPASNTEASRIKGYIVREIYYT